MLLNVNKIIIPTTKLKKIDTKDAWGQKSASKVLLIGHIGIRISIRWLVIVPPDSVMVQRHFV